MKSCILCFVLLVAVASSATINTPVRSNATWNSSASTTCVVNLTTTNSTDLLVLWTYWRTSTANTLSASVNHTQFLTGPFVSAVGPTLQSASNTAAQIFYFRNITFGGDNITVTFSGSADVSSGCVLVEYAGLDLNYPLDSTSAGYSISAGTLLDSGNAAPANPHLLVFGAATTSGSGLGAGTGFTQIQTAPLGTSITEGNTTDITGNNTLQRATATSAPSGNW